LSDATSLVIVPFDADDGSVGQRRVTDPAAVERDRRMRELALAHCRLAARGAADSFGR
jgi:hypothetical protein